MATAISAMADAPFLPFASAPDHVVTMETHSFGHITGTRTHTHHAGWTRIDAVERGRPETRYFGHAGSILVNIGRDASGALSFFSVRRGDEPGTHYNRDRFKTGETRTILGETCHVWNVLRSTNTSLALLSCVTDDGIELWRAYVGHISEISSATAKRIERRAVLPSDVRPPVEALSLKAWNESIDLTGKTAPESPGDYEAVIEAVAGSTIPSRRVTRIYAGITRGYPSTTAAWTGSTVLRCATKRAVFRSG